MNYNNIKNKYPEYISKDQMYRICHISKEKAKFLLDNGLVACAISDKKTRKYKIALEEVIKYLRNKEKIDSRIPRGIKRPMQIERKRATIIPDYSTEQIKTFLCQRFCHYDDVVETHELTGMLGYSRSHIQKLIQDGIIKSIKMSERQYIIPKQYVIDYMISRHYRGTVIQSPNYKGIWNDFAIWLQ